MALLKPGGYGHSIQQLDSDTYIIRWHYDVKYRRIRFPRTISRVTDHAGAERFMKKWGIRGPARPPYYPNKFL